MPSPNKNSLRNVRRIVAFICYQTVDIKENREENDQSASTHNWLLQSLLRPIDPWPNMKFLIMKHRDNWHSLIRWRANHPWKDKWTRECFAWDQVKFECVFQQGIWLFAGTPCWECSPSDECCLWKLKKEWAADQVMTESLSLICWYMFGQSFVCNGKLSLI